MNRLQLIISLCMVGIIASCAAFGTNVKMFNPQPLSSMKTVAIWPILVIPLVDKVDEKFTDVVYDALANDMNFHEKSRLLSSDAEWFLWKELDSANIFSVIRSDSVTKLVTTVDSNFTKFKRTDWTTYREAIDAEGILFTHISFGRESSGINSYVTLSLVDRKTGEQIVEAKFNTKWGKSYMMPQQVEKTLPDAIHGAVVGLVKKLQKQPEFQKTYSSR